jgi:hypothetical protein
MNPAVDAAVIGVACLDQNGALAPVRLAYGAMPRRGEGGATL